VSAACLGIRRGVVPPTINHEDPDPSCGELRVVTTAENFGPRRVLVHSIWEIVLHMTAWTDEVARRLLGGVPDYPAAGDWPAVPPLTTEAEWAHALAALDDSHRDLVAALRGMKAASLAGIVGSVSNPQLGIGVSYAAMVRGVAQHDAYHTGQIAILKKLFRSRRLASAL
jgi:uncharacterized damage-inducible protein DinB